MDGHFAVFQYHNHVQSMIESRDSKKEDVLANTKTIAAQVLESLQRNPSCEFDTLVTDCSEFTWNQIFFEVDRLSRLGQLLLTPVGDGHYFLRLPNERSPMKPKPTQSHVQRASLLSQNVPTGQGPDQASLSGPRSAETPAIAERHISIARRAYQLYEEQGRQDGYALEHWLIAERELSLR